MPETKNISYIIFFRTKQLQSRKPLFYFWIYQKKWIKHKTYLLIIISYNFNLFLEEKWPCHEKYFLIDIFPPFFWKEKLYHHENYSIIQGSYLHTLIIYVLTNIFNFTVRLINVWVILYVYFIFNETSCV